PYASIESAIEAIASGRPVVVVDDANRENEGDLILAAEKITPEAVAFFLRHTSGVLCVALPGGRCDALQLPPMVARGEESQGTAFTVSVDARRGIATGISASDRAATIRVLASEEARADDLVRPGHVFPLRARRRPMRTDPRRREHDAARGARGVRPRARVAHPPHRRSRRLPATHRAARREGFGGTPPDAPRPVRGHRLSRSHRGPGTRGARSWRRSRAGERALTRTLRVPDRRPLRLAALRLRRAARGCDGARRASRQGGRRLSPWS